MCDGSIIPDSIISKSVDNIEVENRGVRSKSIVDIEIGSIWNSEYVRHLGILDHLHELIELNNLIIKLKQKIKFLKGSSNGSQLENEAEHLKDGYKDELADLFIILSKEFGLDLETMMSNLDDNNKCILSKRVNKFIQNSQKDNIKK